MGCDIHGWVEKKVGEKWIGIAPFKNEARDRNYERFGKLANVRTDGPEPKGLPLDISDSAGYEAEGWGVDGHSHSWLPLEEAAKIWLETQWVPDDENAKRRHRDWVSKYPYSEFFNVESEDVSSYRVVFWFDN